MIRSLALVPLLVSVVATLLGLTACPGKKDKPTEPASKKDAGAQPLGAGAGSDAPAAVVLPPAPPLPDVPLGLPAPTRALVDVAPTPELVELGRLLFADARLSESETLSCASCHVPTSNFAGPASTTTAANKRNLRRAPALVNLAWERWLGWDGSASAWSSFLPGHLRGQLGQPLETSVARLLEEPQYAAHFERVKDAGGPDKRAEAALASYVLTRYSGGAAWDKAETSGAPPANLRAGYQLFVEKAQCAICHPPPLYTDHDFHRIGLIRSPDEGRARIDGDAQHKGMFRTPSLRGIAAQSAFFHDGSATSLAAAIDFHLAGGTGQGADRSIIDGALAPVTLAPEERANLEAFVRALTPTP